MFKNNVGIAGNFRHEQTSINRIGNIVHPEMENVVCSVTKVPATCVAGMAWCDQPKNV